VTPVSRALHRAAFGTDSGLRVARSPGRVNLIGEHTDYNDLPVLPMALQRETRIVFSPRDDARVRLVASDPRFPPREFEVSAAIEPGPAGDWGNYARAAAQALAREAGVLRGFDGAVEGDLPAAAGLSSSSALVVACALALLAANGRELAPLALAELLADGERYVGTRSGGMDQAICLAARAGHALKIDFAPLRVEAVAVPPDWRFVVAHSLIEADKAGAAREAYNSRRAQCEQALAALGARGTAGAGAPGFPALLERYGAVELLRRAERELDGVPLRRLRHVVTEAGRVERAREALLAGDARRFGALMDASHGSLASDYEVSHPELDALVACARASGALGARLTGAGFGGCVVALARERDVEPLVAGLERGFYAARRSAVREPVLVAVPSRGASVEPL
jgi:galactokinase